MEKYLKLKLELAIAKEKLYEVMFEISDYGFPSFRITDMPKGSMAENDQLEMLFDLERELQAKVCWLEAATANAFRNTELMIDGISNPKARVVHRLRYVHDLTDNEIMDETGFSYWNIKKLFQRNKK